MNEAILALDVGTVRIGVAVCEEARLPALPLTTIVHTNRAQDVERIVELARQREARTIVVGYPLRMDGSEGPAAQGMDRFIAALRAKFDGDVIPVDERLTTAAADKRLLGSGLAGRKRRQVVDRFAAVEILESYRATLLSES
ncbi:MAG: Holliday junction resolvase RuvX [Candidatus Eremiobacteraeota bacterium]|nr:Holliday junction resolvase RuvX [Candidatus Eremiobacteraeota bacterium]